MLYVCICLSVYSKSSQLCRWVFKSCVNGMKRNYIFIVIFNSTDQVYHNKTMPMHPHNVHYKIITIKLNLKFYTTKPSMQIVKIWDRKIYVSIRYILCLLVTIIAYDYDGLLWCNVLNSTFKRHKNLKKKPDFLSCQFTFWFVNCLFMNEVYKCTYT